MEDVARAFLACRLPNAAEADLSQRLSDARRDLSARGYRWIRREHWHLTLRFFGALAGNRRPAVEAAIADVAAATAPIAARLGAVRALPSWRAPRVVAFDIASDGALESLAARLHASLADVVGPPDKPFLAHLSVLRIKRASVHEFEHLRASLEALDAADAPSFRIASIVLYRSDLEREGPRYTVLREFPFAQAAQIAPS